MDYSTRGVACGSCSLRNGASKVVCTILVCNTHLRCARGPTWSLPLFVCTVALPSPLSRAAVRLGARGLFTAATLLSTPILHGATTLTTRRDNEQPSDHRHNTRARDIEGAQPSGQQ